MISRIWHGWTTIENADIYEKLITIHMLPGILAEPVAAPGIEGPARLVAR